MSQIKYTQVTAFLDDIGQRNARPQVFLVYGENYIVRQIAQRLETVLLENESGSFSVDTLEGGAISMGDVIEEITTFSFLSPQKMVILKNAPLFAGSGQADVPFSASDTELLGAVIERGLPENHYFIITTSTADKRKKIYKIIEKKGCCIDCAVSQGLRKADKDEQNKVLESVAAQILKKSGKIIDRQAFLMLVEQTGFNLDLLKQNLEKLSSYSGSRETITITDITTIVHRDKKDPIFSLTNAMMDKNSSQSIFYLNSLLKEGYHPLQILKSLENQMRKLLMAKIVATSFKGAIPQGVKGMTFNQFKQSALPKVVEYDLKTKALIESGQKIFNCQSSGKKKKDPKDLLLAPNPKNAYPVFQLFQKSEHFSLTEVQNSIIFLSDLDLRMKSSSFEAKAVIEHFLLTICSREGFKHATKNQNRRHRI